MELAVNDMDIYEHITPEFLRRRMDFTLTNARPRRDGDEPTRQASAAVAVPALRGPDSGRPRLHDQGAEARSPCSASSTRAQAQPHGGGAADRRDDRRRRPTRPTRREDAARRPGLQRVVHLPRARRGSMPPTAAAMRRSFPARTVHIDERHRRRRRHGGRRWPGPASRRGRPLRRRRGSAVVRGCASHLHIEGTETIHPGTELRRA